LADVLVALAAVLIALATVLIALIVSVALTVFIAVGIDAAVIIAEADIDAAVIIAEADIVVVEDIAAEDDSLRFIIGNPVAYREEPLQSSQGLFFLSINIRDKLQYIR
jgi:hypothetical protein